MLIVAVLFSFAITTVNAQGGGQQMTPEQRAAMMKERLKPLGLTDVQSDSVVVVYSDRSYMTAAGITRETPPEERQEKMKGINEAREKRLTKSIGADLTKKVMELMAQQQRPPGNVAK